MITLIIDDIEVKAEEGTNLLWAALDNGLYIPNLCAIREAAPPLTSCRLCFVEIEGINTPVTSCSEKVKDGMVVHLNTPKVQRIRNTAFELLISHHHLDCAHCDKNRNCDLQNIAKKMGLKLKLERFHSIPRELPVDSTHPLFYYNPNKCILCGKCIWACHQEGSGILDFAFRGIDTIVTTFAGLPLVDSGCTSCLACVSVCPVGSLVLKSDMKHRKHKTVANIKKV